MFWNLKALFNRCYLHFCAVVLFSLFCAVSYSQTPVTRIYTDLGGYWTSGTDGLATTTNRPHNLLGFRTGPAGSTIFSTGVNNGILTANSISFNPQVFQALPVIGITSSSAGGGTYIGLAKQYFTPGVDITGGSLSNPIGSYLMNGLQGLDLGSGVYNVPSSVLLRYPVQNFDASTINDGIPDIIATQMGDPGGSGSEDRFRFTDINNNTVGNELSVQFSGVDPVGNTNWAFYNANQMPMPYTSNPTGARPIRMLAFDIGDFGINAGNIADVRYFVHRLSGASDPAFTAYNVASFAPASLLDACTNSIIPSIWLDANNGVNGTTNPSDNTAVATWQERTYTTVYQQSTATDRPAFHTGIAARRFNFNPHIHFTNDWLLNPGHPFIGPGGTSGSFDLVMVASAHRADLDRVFNVSMDGQPPSGKREVSVSLTNGGGLQSFVESTSTLNSTTLSGTEPSVWYVRYQRGGNVTIYRNGILVGTASAGTATFADVMTRIGNSGANFRLAELLFFPGNSSDTERRKITSFLSVKYGITMTGEYRSGNLNTLVWNASSGYHNRVFGIAAESCFGYVQRQGRSEADQTYSLMVGAGTIATTNRANTAAIEDGAFLVFGDNGVDVSNANNISMFMRRGECMRVTGRRWRVQRTGITIQTMDTQVKIRIDQINWNQTASAAATDYFLMIDRNANGGYEDAADAIITASSLETTDGRTYAVFNDVRWDSDGSGNDLFTIAQRSSTQACGTVINPAIRARSGNN